MTLTFGGEVHEQRGGRLEIGTGGSFTRTFLVTTNDPEADGPYEACFCSGVPRLGDVFPSDYSYTCRTITPNMVANPALSWYVTCEYSRRSGQPEDEPENPLNAPVNVEISGVKVQKPITKDVNGLPICTSSLQAFDPPPEITRTHQVTTFIRNEPFYNPAQAQNYIDKVNSGSYLGFAAGEVKCNDISATNAFLNGQEYWVVRYVFEHNPDGWQLSLLNVSYHELDGSGDVRKIQDADGRDVAVPWPLVLATGAAQSAPLTSSSFNYRTFDVFETANFNSLGLPT